MLARGIALGHITPNANWAKCDWHFGAFIVTDAGYEVGNDIQLVKMGVKAASDVSAAYNRDLVEVATKNATTIQAF